MGCGLVSAKVSDCPANFLILKFALLFSAVSGHSTSCSNKRWWFLRLDVHWPFDDFRNINEKKWRKIELSGGTFRNFLFRDSLKIEQLPISQIQERKKNISWMHLQFCIEEKMWKMPQLLVNLSKNHLSWKLGSILPTSLLSGFLSKHIFDVTSGCQPLSETDIWKSRLKK